MRKLAMDELNRLSPEQFENQQKIPLVLVLDNVRSALNVGSAFRTADAFALEKIYLCGITATPPHREILKTALGASETVQWEYFEKPKEALEKLRAEKFTLIAVEQADDSTGLHNFIPDSNERYALIFGNEVTGVSEQIMNTIDLALEVPQFGTKHSLNIAVCIGIVVWDIFSKVKLKKRYNKHK
jgi:tRNA G18 (ribose-2'-O)-methylase SpoU